MHSFKAHYQNGLFAVVLEEINHSVISMSFDTGAVNTVISLHNYFDQEIDKNAFVKKIESKCRHKVFHTASATPLDGYLVCAENVMVSGYKIDQFFYYLLPDPDYNVALLGNDFISNCDFHHDLQNDIVVKTFDDNGYKRSAQNAMNQNEINRILGLGV